MKRVVRIGGKRKSKPMTKKEFFASDVRVKVEMIQALIPIGLMAVAEELKAEVEQLAGVKHSREGGLPGHCRWGTEMRSVYLADQKLRGL